MANETTEEQQQQGQSGTAGEKEKMVKGYRKKGLISEKVLLERLSDLSIEDNILNPVITLSSVEDEDDSAMEEGSDSSASRRKGFGTRGPLKASLSLDVPSMNLEQEAKRPPL